MKIETSIEVLFKKELFRLSVLLCFVFSDSSSAQSLSNNPNVFISKGITVIESNTVSEKKEISFSQKPFSIYIIKGTTFIDVEEKVSAKIAYVNLKSKKIRSLKSGNQHVEKNIVVKKNKERIVPESSVKISRNNSGQHIAGILYVSKAITPAPSNNTSKVLATVLGSVILNNHNKIHLKIKYFYTNSIKKPEQKNSLSIRPPPYFISI